MLGWNSVSLSFFLSFFSTLSTDHFSCGMLSIVTPLYQSEVSPARERGRMVGAHGILVVTGYVGTHYPDSIHDLTPSRPSPHGPDTDVTSSPTQRFNGVYVCLCKVQLCIFSKLHQQHRINSRSFFSRRSSYPFGSHITYPRVSSMARGSRTARPSIKDFEQTSAYDRREHGVCRRDVLGDLCTD